MSSTDIHDAKNSAVWKNPQGVYDNIVALQNENNPKNELAISKINNLHKPFSLILAKFRAVVLNMG
jgi:hypothetical protein